MSTRKNQLDNFFPKRLHELRTSADLTQDKLAEKLGISSKVTINRWEKGVRKPDRDNCQALATYFNVNLDWLTDGIGPKRPTGQPITDEEREKWRRDGHSQAREDPDVFVAANRTERHLFSQIKQADHKTIQTLLEFFSDKEAKPEGKAKNGTEG